MLQPLWEIYKNGDVVYLQIYPTILWNRLAKQTTQEIDLCFKSIAHCICVIEFEYIIKLAYVFTS